MTTEIKPFKILVPKQKNEWILERVRSAHIIPDIGHSTGQEWDHGVPSNVIKSLVNHWKTDFDWYKVQDHINSTFQMFTTDIEEAGETINLHFVHHRSDDPSAVPLLFAHGWPGNFLEVENLLRLTKSSSTGEQAFHIVAPTIPGFVFSSAPKKPGFTIENVATVYHKLMVRLGYNNYIGQAGDWGSLILRLLAINHSDAIIGLHINFPVAAIPSAFKNPLTLLYLALRWFTPDQKERLARMQKWLKDESGYSKIQGSKPQTVSYALLDSPVGMLAWIREALEHTVQPDYEWSKDRVITWTTLYLLSENASHARIYKENGKTVSQRLLPRIIPREVSVGVSCFPRDVAYIPRWWAEVGVARNIVFWREHQSGGHFPSVECPDALIQDFLDFVAETKKNTRWSLLTVSK